MEKNVITKKEPAQVGWLNEVLWPCLAKPSPGWARRTLTRDTGSFWPRQEPRSLQHFFKSLLLTGDPAADL